MLIILIIVFLVLPKITESEYKDDVSASFDEEMYPFRDEQFTYDREGFLRIHGNWTGDKARPVNLFFEEIPAVQCKEKSNQQGLYFDLIFCLLSNTSCSKGMTICYEPELPPEKVKNASKHAIYNVHEKVDCKNKSLHGLHVRVELSRKSRNFTLISSIDENIYKFSLPLDKKCFQIRVGTSQSIATQITDLDDEKLDVTPSLETIDEGRKWIDDGWAQNKANFHLFSLDFIPRKNMKFLYTGDYYKKFSYFGGGNTCGMYMKIAGEYVHRCHKCWENILDQCNWEKNQTMSKFKNLDFESPWKNRCNITLKKTSYSEEQRFSRTSTTSGSWNTTESYLNYFKLDITGQNLPLGTYNIPIEFLKWEEYTKKMDHVLTDKAVEKASQSSTMRTITTSESYEFAVQLGEKMILQILKIKCNGWIYTTDYIRAKLEET